MQESLEASLVRIHATTGQVVGAGFFVGERQILTCAHVVAGALGLADDTLEKPEALVSLDVPRVAPRQILAARVVLWRPQLPDGGDDIAGLELESNPPPGSKPATLAQVEDLWDHSFRAFGFPRGQDSGVWTTGRLLGRQVINWVQIEDVKESGFGVEPGFSGTPVWDRQVEAVVGMVVAAERRTNLKTAFAIPVDVLAGSWPLIESLIHPFVFLCYARADSEIITHLKTDLLSQGIHVWIDREGLQPGTLDWEECLRTAIRAARAVLLIASPNARSSRYVRDELRIAELYQRPIYPLWIAGTQWIDAVPLGWGATQYIDARENAYKIAIPTLVEVLNKVTLPPPKAPEPDFTPRNPYKGLRAFSSDDAHDFFGRDTLINELATTLEDALALEEKNLQCIRLLTIVGPSGSGKSSVVMAGLLPRLREGRLPGSEQWIYLNPIVPGMRPIEALTLALSEHLPDKSLKVISEDLQDDSARGLHLLAAKLAKRKETKVVLLVDQFEELFTQTSSEDERHHFLDLLMTASTEPHGPMIVLLTLRADFYDRPMRYPSFHQLMLVHQSSVLPMSIQELREVIEKPAALPDVHLTFEGDLVGDLLFEVQGQVGALPLLQFTLEQLFQRRSGLQLTLAAYREIGGVKGALTRQAEETYAALPTEEHRKLARALFLRLIDPGTTEQDTTRRRASLTEFILTDATQTLQIQQAMNAFITARLLTTNEIAGTTLIEVSHEALIREWTRLGTWAREAREDVPLQQSISEDVTTWEQNGKPKDRLYRGSQLKEASAWMMRNVVSEKEATFLQESEHHQIRSRISFVALALLLVLATGLIVQFIVRETLPDPTRVTNTFDSGPGSLRGAIELADDGSTITISPDLHGTIQLSKNLNFGKSLTIRGPGADKLAISSGSRNFGIGVDIDTTVTIIGLVFKNSHMKADSSNAFGSFIHNNGTLILIDCKILSNTAAGSGTVGGGSGSGGGISNYGKLVLNNSVVSGNTALGGQYFASLGVQGAGGSGGGIYNSGMLTLNNSTVSDNISEKGIGATNGNANGGGSGGGIYNSGMLTLNNSIISGNIARGGDNGSSPFGSFGNNGGSGGGIYNSVGSFKGDGTVVLNHSIVDGNIASAGKGTGSGGYGGGITISSYISTASLTLINSTVSNNVASGNAKDNGGSGGGIFNQASKLTLIRSTVSDNQTTGGHVGDDKDSNSYYYGSISLGSGGGGIANSSININSGPSPSYQYGTLTLINSTIAGNTVTSSGGGVINWGGSKASIIFCTIYGNSAKKGGGIDAEAGYILTGYDNKDQPQFTSVPSHVQIRNSIVISSPTSTSSAIMGTFTTEGYNLIQKSTGTTFADPDKIHHTDIIVTSSIDANVDSQLSGKPPQFHILLASSPAIDYIPLAACHVNSITTDQRGMRRPDENESACDIGAYEYVDPPT
jgi:hypothetical protein